VVAEATLKLHQEKPPLFVAERIGTLAAEGNAEGVAAWKAIARRMAALSEPPPPNVQA
jgi:hypothetical protein